MADIINLDRERNNRELIWVCNCGSTSFRCFADGYLECYSCDALSRGGINGEWRKDHPQPPPLEEAPELGEDTFHCVQINSTAIHSKRIAKLLSDRGDEFATSMLFFKSGKCSVYAPEIGTLEQYNWLKRQIIEALKMVKLGVDWSIRNNDNG